MQQTADGRTTGGGGGAPPEGDTLVVRPDRRQVRYFMRFLLVSVAGFLLASVSSVFTDRSTTEQLVFTGFSLYVALALGYLAYIYGRLIAVDALAEIGPWGIRYNDLGRGWIVLPWEAIASVRKDVWGRIILKTAPGVGPDTPGTGWPDDPATTRRARWARRWGFRMPMRVAAPDAATVLAAVAHLSAGRVGGSGTR